MRIVRQQFDETAQRQKRAVEDQRAAAALAQFAVAIKFDRKPGQFVLPRCFAWCDGVTGSNQQCAMDAMGGDCVRGCEFPAGKNRLHNLITERDPFDAIEQRGFGPEFLGPEFLGPEFLGPEFLGPEFLGPEFLGPEFLGPEFLGPEFLTPDSLPARFGLSCRRW
jgi:hypothetical protein